MSRSPIAAPIAAPTAAPIAAPAALLAVVLLAAAHTLSGAPDARAARLADVCGALAGNTTWTAAGGPYVTTCDIAIPAGATLTIEAGTIVQLGTSHKIDVSGVLNVAGTSEQPVRFEKAGTQPWGSIQLRTGSGPSTITNADIGGGGALRKEMLGIETDLATITRTNIHDTAGVGVEIRAGASPTLLDNLFVRASTPSAQPSAALRILGASKAEVRGNRFESNQQYPIYLDGAANALLSGNRFEYNAYNAVLVAGHFTGQTTLHNLGPRRYAYHVRNPLSVRSGAELTIAPGATLHFFSGSGLAVEGTLRAIGQPGREILFSGVGDPGPPGKWGQLRFADSSTDFDAPSSTGSRLEHAILEWAGFDPSGALLIQRSSPRIAYVTVRNSGSRGVTVEGDGARPELLGLHIHDCIAESSGIGLQVRAGARPTLRFSTIEGNWLGVDVRAGAVPNLNGHNRIVGNATFAVRADDIDTVCVPARANDWGAPDGPRDGSTRPDACDAAGADHAGAGQLVTDGVDYTQWVGQLLTPSITSPRCGQIADPRPTLSGDGPADSTVILFDGGAEIGRTTTAAVGAEGVAPWTLTPTRDLAPGGHALQARAENAAGGSAPSEVLGVVIDPESILLGDRIAMRQTLEGTRYSQPYASGGGCAVVSDDSAWQVSMHPGAPLELQLGARCPSGGTVTARYRDADVPLQPGDNGLWTGTLDMADGGALQVTATCGTRRQSVDLGTVQVALNGFVHDAFYGVDRRVQGAKVTLYRFDAAINNFRVWKASDHGDQTNPQTTGFLGWYGFYPPPGRYRAVVSASGYAQFIAPEVPLVGQPYHVNVALQPLATPRPKPAAIVYLPLVQRLATRP